MKRRWRAVIFVGGLAAQLALLRFGWTYAQVRFANWIKVEHVTAGWKWHVYGAQRDGWLNFRADSVQLSNPTLSIRLHTLDLSAVPTANAYSFPLATKIHVGRAAVALRPSTSAPDSTPPRFPVDLQIPLGLDIQVDTTGITTAGRDSSRALVHLLGLHATSRNAQSVEIAFERLDPRGINLHTSAKALIDWTESDTLRVDLAGLVSTGCCEQDSVVAKASLQKANLTSGHVEVTTAIENSRGWGEIIPALAKAPALHQVKLDAWLRLNKTRPEFGIKLNLASDSLAFLPGMQFQIEAAADSTRGSLLIEASREGGQTLLAQLNAAIPKRGSLMRTTAKGDIRIDDLGWFTSEANHPLDGNIQIRRLDSKGASISYQTDAGSTIDASVVWKGLHWNLDAQIAPGEPWAVEWVKGLAMHQTGSVHGTDSSGGALFRITARQPRMAVASLDSLSTTLWIGPGPHLIFSNILASDSNRTWRGSGEIVGRDSVVRFNLHPSSDSVASIELETHFDGRVRIAATAFPTAGLPIQLPIPLPFAGKLDALMRQDPPHMGKSVSWITASLRAKPGADSLLAKVDMSLRDSSIQLPSISIEIGGSRLDATLAASIGAPGWGLDTLRVSTERFDIAKAYGLWPAIPKLKGQLKGYFLSQRGDGVSAAARLESAQILDSNRSISLPDLLLWGERDTLHLGGWIPAGGYKAPFHLTATHLWDPTPEFKLKAFWGDILKFEASGAFREKKDLETSFRLVGSTVIPGTEARLQDIAVTGGVVGHLGDKGFDWKAKAEGSRGILTALAGNPLDLRFQAVADPKEIRIDKLSLSGVKNGRFDASGRWDLTKKALTLSGNARQFRIDLGLDKRLELDSLGISASSDSRIRLAARNALWHQSFKQKNEKLDIGISRADLLLIQAKDWKKLSGDITVDKLLFSKNFAQVSELLKSITDAFRHKRTTTSSSSSGPPLLLDIQATSSGDDIRVTNNLGRAKLGFDLQVTGPTDAPLLNGFVAADPDSGQFGYLRRNFSMDTLRVDWNTAMPLQGKFVLSGSHLVKKSCSEEQKSAFQDSSAFCKLILSSQGTLDNPRLSGLTSECATAAGDDGTMGAFVALATDCYPQPNSQSNMKWGNVVRDGTIDFAYGYGMGWFNQVLAAQLSGSRNDAAWLPDSVLLTDFPVGGLRDQLGLLAIYHITPDFDGAVNYKHTFTQAGASASGTPVLTDDYGASLKYRIPFWWIEEEDVRRRLTNRLFLQLDANQGLDENLRRSTILQPSLRYRWEFW